MKKFLVLVALLVLGGGAFYAHLVRGLPRDNVRAIWVSRFEYSTPADVRSIVENCAGLGFTDLFFQVRGYGTSFYASEVEPWAYELTSENRKDVGRNPGWDPLRFAAAVAKERGIRLHAYINVLPGWKGGQNPPEWTNQLWGAHRDWFMVDRNGDAMKAPMGWYTFLNPVLPAVRAHLRLVVRELCKYDIAGVHLDYIRYPHGYRQLMAKYDPSLSSDELDAKCDFSYDVASLRALEKAYGAEPTRAQVEQFRCDSITRVVQELQDVAKAELGEQAIVSASVLGDPAEGRHYAFQDQKAWVRAGDLDWVVPMNYATTSFGSNLKKIRQSAGWRGYHESVVVGVYGERDVATVVEQIATLRTSGCRGIAFFSYQNLFDSKHQMRDEGRQIARALFGEQ